MSGDAGWFSSKLRIVSLVQDGDALAIDVMHVFRAVDFDDAFDKALVLGRSHEQEYRNAKDQLVSCRFKEIISLDLIQQPEIDGAEVFSEFVDLNPTEVAGFPVAFRPEESKPRQTL